MNRCVLCVFSACLYVCLYVACMFAPCRPSGFDMQKQGGRQCPTLRHFDSALFRNAMSQHARSRSRPRESGAGSAPSIGAPIDLDVAVEIEADEALHWAAQALGRSRRGARPGMPPPASTITCLPWQSHQWRTRTSLEAPEEQAPRGPTSYLEIHDWPHTHIASDD